MEDFLKEIKEGLRITLNKEFDSYKEECIRNLNNTLESHRNQYITNILDTIDFCYSKDPVDLTPMIKIIIHR